MNLAAWFAQQNLHAAARLLPYVLRDANPVTGAPKPQAATAKAPPAPPVI